MAGKVKQMSTIKQLIRLHLSGISNRKIGKELKLYKGTVNTYVQKMSTDTLTPQELLELDDPVLENCFHAGSPAYTDSRFDVVKNLFPDWEKEFKNKHVTKQLLWEEYRLKYPGGYSRSQFCYHIDQMTRACKPSAVLTHVAGEKLFY